MINQVTLLGRLANEPESKVINDGKHVTKFSLATSEKYKDKESVEYHRIVVWGQLAQLCAQYLAKGKMAFVQGKIQTRSWEDQQGQKKYSTEIIADTVRFLSPKGEVNNSEDFSDVPF